MTIIVNDIAASIGGALSVLIEFYNFIRNNKNYREINWVFLLSEPFLEPADNIEILVYPKKKFNWFRRIWFDNVTLGLLCRKYRAGGVISLQNTLGILRGIPQMVYVHQVIPFQREKKFSFLKKEELVYAIYQYIIGRFIKNSIKRSSLTIVQAEWIKEVAIQQTGVSSDKIMVNPVSCNQNGNMNTKSTIAFIPHAFFYPAFECIYKNQQVIRKACQILQAEGIRADVELTIENDYPESYIIKAIGKQPHHVIMRKYCERTLIFPSYLETVGLPLVEAMQCNSIILAADCKYARETLSEYDNAYFFDPFDSIALASLMKKVINGDIVKAIHTEQRPRTSNWDIVLNKFISLIHSTL